VEASWECPLAEGLTAPAIAVCALQTPCRICGCDGCARVANALDATPQHLRSHAAQRPICHVGWRRGRDNCKAVCEYIRDMHVHVGEIVYMPLVAPLVRPVRDTPRGPDKRGSTRSSGLGTTTTSVTPNAALSWSRQQLSPMPSWELVEAALCG
jgi:hypothetical protein